MAATSDSGLPVSHHVTLGPAFVNGNTLRLTPLAPKAKRLIKVVVVAWQFGRQDEPKVRQAEPVEREFRIR